MRPVLAEVGGVPILTHDVCMLLGISVAACVFAREARYRGRSRDERLWGVVAGALAGGALLGRLGTWAQHLDPRANATFVEQWLYGNRSILSGLVGAYLGALVAKRLLGVRERTGDLFAPAVALGMAVGRVGCLLSELPGTPTSLPWGMSLTPLEAARFPGAMPGVLLHPSFAYEIMFQLLAFLALRWLRGRVTDLLSLYLVAYGVFRFTVEFVRGNEIVFAGLSRPQLFLLACLPFGVWHLLRRYRREPTAPMDSTVERSTTVPSARPAPDR